MQQFKPIRNEEGLVVDFEIEGDFPKYGMMDRVDDIAVDFSRTLHDEIT
ncbi:pyruvate formate lyase family protein [Staphylococcus aureus]